MIKQICIFLLLLSSTLAGYNCRTPDNCMVYCNNFKDSQIKMLKNTNWIAVPWNNGNCYFHNTKTREDTDIYPLGQNKLSKKYY